MKKWFGFGLAVVGLYLLAVFIWAELEEQKAEKRIIEILTEVASPSASSRPMGVASKSLYTSVPFPIGSADRRETKSSPTNSR